MLSRLLLAAVVPCVAVIVLTVGLDHLFSGRPLAGLSTILSACTLVSVALPHWLDDHPRASQAS